MTNDIGATDRATQQWKSEGYCIVRDILDPDRVVQLRAICDDILAQWRVCDPQTGQPGERPDATNMRHLNHPAYFGHTPEGLRTLMDSVCDGRVLNVASAVLGEAPLFRCTSLFFNPSGVHLDGNWHRDSQFGASSDDDERNMLEAAPDTGEAIQLQIALVHSEDIELVPTSHLRWDTHGEYAIRKGNGGKNNRSNAMPGAVRCVQEPGDAILFNPLALHRGRYHSDKLRRTVLLTYTKTSAPIYDYFSDQPWFLEPGYMEKLSPGARPFFDRFVNQYRDFWLKQKAS